MLESLDICLMLDSRGIDGAGNVITLDRSKRGIHAQFGDGVTAGVMPTWLPSDAKATFDGGDYMRFPTTYDVGGILASMGSIQDETYLFYLSPMIVNSTYQYLLQHNSQVGTSRFFIRIEDTNIIWMNGENAVATTERLTTGSVLNFNKKEVLLALVRNPTAATKRQIAYINGAEFASDSDALVDCSNAIKAKYIGVNDAGGFCLQTGTGLRFFGYVRRAVTQTWLQALNRYLRGNL